MNRVISWIENVLVRTILSASIIVIAFLFSTAINYENSLQAQAAPLTPEATKYEVNKADSPFRENAQEKVNQLFKENKQPQEASKTTQEIGENLSKPAKATKQKLENAADTVREKLNLDQPHNPGTKEVSEDVANAIRGNQG
jgi:hypothetical protein